MYDAAIGRFFTLDRFSEKYNFQSPFSYAKNNPILYLDINGDSAWTINSQWSSEMVAGYRNYVRDKANEMRESGTSCTCEDFALSTLIDYASQNNLPVSITNDSGTFSAASDSFNSTSEFKDAVLTTTGARDLQNPMNTVGASLSNPQPGDLFLLRNNQNTAFHVQQVIHVDKQKIQIAQGNSGFLNSIPGSSRVLGAGNPNSPFYTGTRIQLGVYDRNTGNYQREIIQSVFHQGLSAGTVSGSAQSIKGFQKFNLEARSWNFKNFK